jgi:hypothetical protein
MAIQYATEPLKIGRVVRIRASGYGRARIAEFRGHSQKLAHLIEFVRWVTPVQDRVAVRAHGSKVLYGINV